MALGVRRLNHLNLSDGELQFRGNFLSVTLNHRSIVAQSRRAVSQGGKLSYRDTKEFSGQAYLTTESKPHHVAVCFDHFVGNSTHRKVTGPKSSLRRPLDGDTEMSECFPEVIRHGHHFSAGSSYHGNRGRTS
jgi:hypothetical protein